MKDIIFKDDMMSIEADSNSCLYHEVEVHSETEGELDSITVDKNADKIFIMDENKQLLELLKYAKEAINYWYDSVDCNDDVREENDNFKNECDYFINKFSLDSSQ